MKITKLKITDYRGIKDLSVEMPERGAVIKGENAQGKTSVINAISAALTARGIGPDSIRIGADRSEIVVDLGDFQIRRAITKKGDSLTVTNSDGDKWAKPQTRLNELLGTSSLDPLSFFLAKPDERRKQILSAIPIEVTKDDLKEWTGDVFEPKQGQHGLEVLGEIRIKYYNLRAEVNREVKELEIKTNDAWSKANSLKLPEYDGLEIPEQTFEDAHLEAAKSQLNSLEKRAEAFNEMNRKTTGAREQIAKLRSQAIGFSQLAKDCPSTEEHDLAVTNVHKAEVALAKYRKELDELETLKINSLAAKEKEKEFNKQADALEKTLNSVAIDQVSDDELKLARNKVNEETVKINLIRNAREFKNLESLALDLNLRLSELKTKAENLDSIVKRLTNDAPKELAKRSNPIPGLSLSGEGITFDDKPIDSLSSAEQMQLSIEIAKRSNSKAKILVVDGLERLDNKRMSEFVNLATSDDWQLIGTRVADGELVVEAIQP